MNKELAKKLKDAGFPFESHISVLGKDINGNPIELEEFVVDRYPTLSELIKACGEDLWILRKGNYMGKDGWVVGKDLVKEGENKDNPNNWEISSFGKIPEEAVSNLWLKLKK